MKFISMEEDPRKAQFEYFRGFSNPYASLTVNCDITPLRGRKPFFLHLLYCAVRAANAVPELRRRIRGDQVVEYDACISSHTVALPDGSYCYCELDCEKPLEEFLPYAEKQVALAKEHPSLTDEDPEKLFFVSCTPWISFTAVTQPLPVPPDSNPRIILGRVFEENGKYLLPVSLTVNHALADGLHMSRFFENLERIAREI